MTLPTLQPSDPNGEETDKYGNPANGDELIYCCFPDCSCDGSRLCMAKNGASENCFKGNVEGMWQRGGKEARKAKMFLMGLFMKKDSTP